MVPFGSLTSEQRPPISIIFGAQLSYEKDAHKMLVKLTPKEKEKYKCEVTFELRASSMQRPLSCILDCQGTLGDTFGLKKHYIPQSQ